MSITSQQGAFFHAVLEILQELVNFWHVQKASAQLLTVRNTSCCDLFSCVDNDQIAAEYVPKGQKGICCHCFQGIYKKKGNRSERLRILGEANLRLVSRHSTDFLLRREASES